MSTCCPPGSLPKLASEHVPKGTHIDVPNSDIKMYAVGSGEKAIIHFYDIFATLGGRNRFICDQLADQGYKVVMPDYYRGKAWGDAPLEMPEVTKFVAQFPPEQVTADTEAVIKCLQSGGVKSIGATGACWGAWAIFTCCAKGLPISAAVNYHPALGLAAVFGSNAVELASKVKSPQLLLPAGNDPADLKPGGDVVKALEANKVSVESVAYEDQVHGFVTRGDLSDAKVLQAVEDATKRTYAFFLKHL